MTHASFQALGLALFGAIEPTTARDEAHTARPLDAIDLTQRFGWLPSGTLAMAISRMDGGQIMALCTQLESAFKEAFGTLKGPTSPLYRAFPRADMLPVPDDLESLLNSVFDANAWGNLSPQLFGADPWTGHQTQEYGADPLADQLFFTQDATRPQGRMRVLHLADGAFWSAKAKTLLASRSPFTPQEQQFLMAAIARGHVDAGVLEGLRFREKLPLLADALDWSVYRSAVETPTDVLRLATHWSGHSPSLQETSRFAISTARAKKLMDALDLAAQRDPDMAREQIARHAEGWKRLVTHIRANRWARRFPHAAQLLRDVRTQRPKTLESRLAKAPFLERLNLLATRPGMYVRSTIALMRTAERAGPSAQDMVLQGLAQAMPKVNALTLLTLLVRLGHTGGTWPHFLPDGKIVRSEPAPVDSARARVLVEGHLRARLQGTLPWTAGPHASDRLVPTAARNASEGSQRLARGSRVRLNAGQDDVLRLFLHWKESCDVDLSVLFLDEQMQGLDSCAFYNLTAHDGNQGQYAVHSGDILNGSKGAAEYIDLHIAKARAAGVRWAVMTANVFSGEGFDTFPAHAGIMVRDGQTGPHFSIDTVAHKMRLSTPNRWVNVAAFDLQDCSLILCDLPISAPQGHNLLKQAAEVSKDLDTLAHMGTYRPDMRLVLDLMGTPGAPALDGERLDAEMDTILEALAKA